MMPSQKYWAISKSANDIAMEILNIIGIERRLNIVPLINNGCMSLSTN
jgi:hypothetical protein